MKALAILALLAANAALAADPVPSPCGGTTTDVWADEFVTPSPLDCAPWPMMGLTNTDSTAITWRRTSGGLVAWWYCKRMAGVPQQWIGLWSRYTAAVSNAALAAAPDYVTRLSASIASASAASNPTAALDQIRQANTNARMDDPAVAAAWCPAWPEIYASTPPLGPSPDGFLSPPWGQVVDAAGAVYRLAPASAGGWVTRNGVATNGKGALLLMRTGALYVKDRAGVWWKWLGANKWTKLTTTMP